MKYGSVILADRHQNMLEGIRGLLEAMFETVVMVADKASLFDTAEKINPDLAVVDLSLPVSSEINIARQLKDKYPDLKIIILSVHDDKTVVSEIMDSGVSGFVLKRSTASDLISAVDEVLGGKTFVSPSLEYEF
ncbi:MAG: response regulator transcription factor [Desulfobulbaceae bacterium]|nr:response regulator transcription factor [Desulfobulbaceae bacterium]